MNFEFRKANCGNQKKVDQDIRGSVGSTAEDQDNRMLCLALCRAVIASPAQRGVAISTVKPRTSY